VLKLPLPKLAARDREELPEIGNVRSVNAVCSKSHAAAAVLPQVVLGREQGEQESGPSPPALKDDPEVQAAGTPPAVME